MKLYLSSHGVWESVVEAFRSYFGSGEVVEKPRRLLSFRCDPLPHEVSPPAVVLGFPINVCAPLLRHPLIFHLQEYWERGSWKDSVVKALASPPFITMVRRAYEFHRSLGRTFLIPPAVFDFPDGKAPQWEDYFLFVARAEAYKNPFFPLKLAEALERPLVMAVRQGRLKGQLERACRASPFCRWIGKKLPWKEYVGLVRHASLLIQPSLMEPIGHAVAQATAWGTAPLVSSTVGVADFLPPSMVVEGFDVEEWARKAERLWGRKPPMELFTPEWSLYRKGVEELHSYLSEVS